jgi:hypothetical protein
VWRSLGLGKFRFRRRLRRLSKNCVYLPIGRYFQEFSPLRLGHRLTCLYCRVNAYNLGTDNANYGSGKKSRRSLYRIPARCTPLYKTRRKSLGNGIGQNWSFGYVMKHYTIEKWVDFFRGLTATEERAEMELHLASGCEECQSLSRLTSRLVDTSRNLASTEVPDYAMRLARAIFPVRVAQRPTRGNRLPIELIFDSFLVPAPAGLRATWQVGWQGLYRAGECSVDLRIEPELKSARASVIGQISNHVAPSVEMSNLAVSLRAGKAVLAETLSNRFGEFQMEYEQQAQLKLWIHLTESRTIQVPLKKLTSDQPANQSRNAAKKR